MIDEEDYVADVCQFARLYPVVLDKEPDLLLLRIVESILKPSSRVHNVLVAALN